ncbi:FliG C-terminal domain-containing protein [Elusimicrobiota bacterium]
MKDSYKRLLVLLLLPLVMGTAEFSDYTTLINQKMETERRLEDHLGGIVTKIVGEGKSTVIVSVVTTDLSKKRVQTEQWLEKKKDVVPEAMKKSEYLPGIPVKSNVKETEKGDSPEKSGGKRIEDILTLPSEFIDSLRVSVILDESIPDEIVTTVETIISEIVDLDVARGDRLTIQRVDFAGKRVDFVGFLFNPYFYIVSLILITLSILGMFLFGPLRKFLFATLQTLKDLKGIKSQTEHSGQTLGGGGGGGGFGAGMGEGEGEMEMEEEEEGADEDLEGLEGLEGFEEGEGEPGEGELEGMEEEEFQKMTYKPLNFLEGKDLKKLAYLLNFEKPDVAALLIDYLDPVKGAKVMAALPEDKKTQVAKSIVKFQRTSQEVMRHIDDFLSKKIDFVTGGSEKLVGMLEVMSEEEREKMLEILSAEDPDFSDKVKSKMFSFDDVVNLDNPAIQMLIQQVETRDLGTAIKNSSDELKQRFMSNMSEGAAALLKEEIEFGRNVTGGQIKAAQQDIVIKIKQMESDGSISKVTKAGSEELWDEEIGEDKKEGVLEGIIKAAQEALDKKESLEGDEPQFDKNRDEIAFEYYEKGLGAYRNGDYSEAIEQFNTSLEYNSDIWQSHQYIGTCYMALGDEEKAKQAYTESLMLNPENTELREWMETH